MRNGYQNTSRTLWERLGIDLPPDRGSDIQAFIMFNPSFATPKVVLALVTQMPNISTHVRHIDNPSLVGDRMLMIQLLSVIVQHAPHAFEGRPDLLSGAGDILTLAASPDERTGHCREWAQAATRSLQNLCNPTKGTARRRRPTNAVPPVVTS